MTTIETVTCFYCEKQVQLCKDGTYRKHTYGSRGPVCKKSGQPHNRHSGEFKVTQRDENGKAVEWVANCLCGRVFLGATYDAVDASWSEHSKEEASAA